MSKPLTISVQADDNFYATINGVAMEDALSFRLTWTLLEDFDDAYGHDYKELPTKFIEDIYDLVDNFYNEHIDESVLLEIFRNALNYSYYKDFQLRVKFDKFSGIPSEILMKMETVNQRMKEDFYEFSSYVVYAPYTRLSDVLKDLGVYDKWYQDLVTSEIENTLDEGWTTFTQQFNEDELNYFKNLSDAEKEVYAHAHAHTFVKTIMESTLENFDNVYGFDYLDADLEVLYQHGDYHINKSGLL